MGPGQQPAVKRGGLMRRYGIIATVLLIIQVLLFIMTTPGTAPMGSNAHLYSFSKVCGFAWLIAILANIIFLIRAIANKKKGTTRFLVAVLLLTVIISIGTYEVCAIVFPENDHTPVIAYGTIIYLFLTSVISLLVAGRINEK